MFKTTSTQGQPVQHTYLTLNRFYGDLWNADQHTRDTACRAIMEARGFHVAQVFRQTTGLWATVRLTTGHLVNIGCDEIRTYVFENTTC